MAGEERGRIVSHLQADQHIKLCLIGLEGGSFREDTILVLIVEQPTHHLAGDHFVHIAYWGISGTWLWAVCSCRAWARGGSGDTELAEQGL